MKYLHLKELEVPLYRGKLVVILTNDKEQLQKYIPEFNDIEPYAHTYLINWKGEQGFVIVLNFDNSYRKIHNGTIIHEVIHATHFIAQERGIEANFINDEPITYLAEFIADQVYKLMKKNKFEAVS
jgi:UDP-galactopyranose mutase